MQCLCSKCQKEFNMKEKFSGDNGKFKCLYDLEKKHSPIPDHHMMYSKKKPLLKGMIDKISPLLPHVDHQSDKKTNDESKSDSDHNDKGV